RRSNRRLESTYVSIVAAATAWDAGPPYGVSCSGALMGSDQYRVYAVRYGHRDNVPAWEAFHKEHAAPVGGMDYFVWAITDGSRTVIVDTGFAEEEGTRRGRTFLRSPVLGLAELGI